MARDTARTVILATNNPHKKKMLAWVVEGYFDKVKEQNGSVEVKETENSFEGNAQLKAIALSKRHRTYAVASDGGILIPSLGKHWNGLLTRRFLGQENVTDRDRIEGLLALMKDKKGAERDMFWHEAIALAYDGKVLFSKEVEGDHSRVQETYDPEQYQSGIWLCTLTYYPQFDNKNFFELTDKEREYAEISWHRLHEATQKYLRTCSSQLV